MAKETKKRKANPNIATASPEDKTGTVGGQFNNKNAEKWTEELALDFGNRLLDWMLEKPELEKNLKSGDKKLYDINLFMDEFLIGEGLGNDIIATLCKKYISFNDLISRAKTIQETKLRKYGCLGMLNPAVTNFCLVNNHAYQSKQTTTHEGSINLSFDKQDENL